MHRPPCPTDTAQQPQRRGSWDRLPTALGISPHSQDGLLRPSASGPCLLHTRCQQAPLCSGLPGASLLSAFKSRENPPQRGCANGSAAAEVPFLPRALLPSDTPPLPAHQPARPPGAALGQSSSASLSLSARALPETFPPTSLSEKPAQREDEAVGPAHPSSSEGPEASGAGCMLTTWTPFIISPKPSDTHPTCCAQTAPRQEPRVREHSQRGLGPASQGRAKWGGGRQAGPTGGGGRASRR